MQQISHNFTPRLCACSQRQAVELKARVSCRGKHCHLEVLRHNVWICARRRKKKNNNNKVKTNSPSRRMWMRACEGAIQEQKQSVNELGRWQNQASRISGWREGHARHHIVGVRTRLQMSPESLAYCLVSSLLVQPTWWPDLSASGFSHQRPLLGESNLKCDPSLTFRPHSQDAYPKVTTQESTALKKHFTSRTSWNH